MGLTPTVPVGLAPTVPVGPAPRDCGSWTHCGCHQKISGASGNTVLVTNFGFGDIIPLMAAKLAPARDRLTDAAVARLLSVSKRTLLRWLKDGVIDPPALVVGKRGQRRWAEAYRFRP